MSARAAHMAELVRLLEAQGDKPTDHLRLMVRLTEFSVAGPWARDVREDALDFAIKALGRSRAGASNLGVSSKVLERLRKEIP